jgi:hypothetical protein
MGLHQYHLVDKSPKEEKPMSKETEKTSTHCRICGRRLTVRVSVEREIGPVCWGRLKRGEISMEEGRK